MLVKGQGHWFMSRVKCATLRILSFFRSHRLSLQSGKISLIQGTCLLWFYLFCFVKSTNLIFQNHWPLCDVHSFDWSNPTTQHHRASRENHVLGVTLRGQHFTTLLGRLSRSRDARVQTRGGPVCKTHLCLSLGWDKNQMDSAAKRSHHHWC